MKAFLLLRSATVLSVVIALPACGSTDDDTSSSSDDGSDPTPKKKVESDTPPGPCDIESGYPGDELCLPPIDSKEGIALHAGPTDYDNPDDVKTFVLPAGEEKTECYFFTSPNTETKYFYEQHYRLRPGSHHLIMHTATGDGPKREGWGRCYGGAPDGIPIGGTQRSISDYPPDGKIPEEDAHLARPLNAHAQMWFELHFVNTTDEALLREAWVNLVTKPKGEKLTVLGGIFMLGGYGMNIPPHTQQTLNYSCTLDAPEARIVSLFGHRHASTERFSVWAHQNGKRTRIYEDYDWQEPAELLYNSVNQNPEPDEKKGTGGGTSGLIELKKGDQLEWECAVRNKTEEVLKFGNEVYTAEMCNLFGAKVGPGGPIWYCEHY